ncbi:sialic acid-binding Ig-like lectin 7 [Pseudorasbora parva]|uniref:sialic acid-binding Ig-like lectin 7 n=1 Tax=Pseudorasbora parva TaxID=51549 RepID=UPI00351EAFF4
MNKAEKILLFSFLLQGVSCRNFNISLPERIEALSGSCVIIKCTFEIEEKYDTYLIESAATGIWRKDGVSTNNQVFNSRDPNSRFKGEITGTLHEKNCTTIFYDVSSDHSGKYYFRIESDGLKYKYESSPSTINVIESPPKPTVKLIEEQEVMEESSVSLRCSAESLCSSPPPTLTWSSTPRIPLSEIRQQELISDLNFTATHRHHRVTFTCTITYQLQDKNKTAQDNITLHVQYAPKISPSSSCIGEDVTVCFCEVDGNPSPELEWRLSGRPVTNSSNTFISEERLNSTGLRSSITLHQSLTHTSTLECVGNNTHGNARKLLQLPLSVNREFQFYMNLSSVMIGVAVGAVLVIMFCAVTFICVRLSIQLKAQNEAADTYASLQLSAPPSEYQTLKIKRGDTQ